MLSAEEFALGGSRIGRAYSFNEVTGDSGGGAGLELGYRLGNLDSGAPGVELLTFLDGGVAVDRNSPAAPRRSRSLASTGVGTRFSIGSLAVSIEAGVPMAGNHHTPRLFMSLFRSF